MVSVSGFVCPVTRGSNPRSDYELKGEDFQQYVLCLATKAVA